MVNLSFHHDRNILLTFNIDGLPLFRSSKVEFWPILGKIFHSASIYSPFKVAIYCGKGKPKKFCANLIDEYNYLTENGIIIISIFSMILESLDEYYFL